MIYLGSFSKTFAPGLPGRLGRSPRTRVRDKLVLAAEAVGAVPADVLAARRRRRYLATAAVAASRSSRSARCTASAATPCSPRSTTAPAGRDLDPAGRWVLRLGDACPTGVDTKAMLPRAVTARVAYVPGTAFYADGSGAARCGCRTATRRRSGSARVCGGWPTSSPPSSTCSRRSAPAAAADRARSLARASARRPAPRSRVTGLERRPSPRSTVLVLAGGLSATSARSRCAPAAGSSRRCARSGVETHLADVDAALLPRSSPTAPDVVFPILHGAAGEDGALRDVLDLLGAAATSARTRRLPAGLRQADRQGRARRCRACRPPRRRPCRTSLFRDLGAGAVLDALVARLGLPLFVKPARGGSALGCALARTREELPAAMVGCFAYGDTALVERFVDGLEIAVSVVDTGAGPVALPAVEIVPDSGVYDYAARYTAGPPRFFVPARISDARGRARCRDRADRAHAARPARPLPDRPHRRRRRARRGSSRSTWHPG